LTGKGHFPEYRWFGLSQQDRYDARAVIRRPDDEESVLVPTAESQFRVVEFKLDAASILRDFIRGDKISQDVKLVIAYQCGPSPSDLYQFIQPHAASPRPS
jgi:hypothetical protein